MKFNLVEDKNVLNLRKIINIILVIFLLSTSELISLAILSSGTAWTCSLISSTCSVESLSCWRTRKTRTDASSRPSPRPVAGSLAAWCPPQKLHFGKLIFIAIHWWMMNLKYAEIHSHMLLIFMMELNDISMAECTTAVSPVPEQWKHHSLALSHQYKA